MEASYANNIAKAAAMAHTFGIEADPESDEMMERAILMFRENRPIQARQLMRAAIQMDPDYQLPRDWLETIDNHISRTSAAEQRLAAAQALSPLASDLMQHVITGT